MSISRAKPVRSPQNRLGPCVVSPDASTYHSSTRTVTFGQEFSSTLDSTDTTHGLQSIAAGAMTFSDAGKILSWSIWAGAPGPLSLQVLAAAKLPIAAASEFLAHPLVSLFLLDRSGVQTLRTQITSN